LDLSRHRLGVRVERGLLCLAQLFKTEVGGSRQACLEAHVAHSRGFLHELALFGGHGGGGGAGGRHRVEADNVVVF